MTAITGRIRKRGNKLEAVISVSGMPDARRATGCVVGQEEEAEKFLAELLAELRQARPAGKVPAPSSGDMTFKAWAEKWVAERKGRGIVSAVDEEAHLRHHVFAELGAFPLRALTKAQMMTWVRTLPDREKLEGDDKLSSRYVHHIAGTVKRLLQEAADIDLIPVNPCVWRKKHLPKKQDTNHSKRRFGGFRGWEVWDLLHNELVAPDRRVLYALEFLTGMRTGEAAVRRWSDVDLTAEPLARLEVKTAWNSRMRKEKSTKTLVEKVVPIHPELRKLLEWWKAEGFRAYVGRDPVPEDLIVPSGLGRKRSASHSNRLFLGDVKRLGLEKLDQAGQDVRRTHYETRSTFRSLALGGGAVERDLDRITHPSPKEASDLYTRLDEVWPLLCQAVLCVRIGPKEAAPVSVPTGSHATGDSPVAPPPQKEKSPNPWEVEAFGTFVPSGGEYGTRTRGLRRDRPAL